MYSFESRVRYSELAENGCLSLDGLINYMQDCASFESEDLGVGMEHLSQRNRTWVLSFWQIVIERYPRMGERITIGTQGCGCEKMFGYRNFVIEDEHGGYVAKANSIWILMDQQRGRPVIVQPEEAAVYGTAEPIPMEYAPRKILLPEGGSAQTSFIVQEYHLDTNHHVNNGQYVRMAAAFLPKRSMVKELRAEYKKQALLGDEVIPVLYETEKGYLVALNGVDGKAYAVVEFFVAALEFSERL